MVRHIFKDMNDQTDLYKLPSTAALPSFANHLEIDKNVPPIIATSPSFNIRDIENMSHSVLKGFILQLETELAKRAKDTSSVP